MSIFTTKEQADLESTLLVSGGTLQPFQRDKLFISLYTSLQHRKDALRAATALTDTVLAKLLPKMSAATIAKADIIAAATETLKNFDHAAHVHYQAYHPV